MKWRTAILLAVVWAACPCRPTQATDVVALNAQSEPVAQGWTLNDTIAPRLDKIGDTPVVVLDDQSASASCGLLYRIPAGTAPALDAGWELDLALRIGSPCRGYVVEVHDGKYRVIVWLFNTGTAQALSLKDAATGKTVSGSLAGGEAVHAWKIARRGGGKLTLSGNGKVLLDDVVAGEAPGLLKGAPYVRVGGGSGIGQAEMSKLEIASLRLRATSSAATGAPAAVKPPAEDAATARKIPALFLDGKSDPLAQGWTLNDKIPPKLDNGIIVLDDASETESCGLLAPIPAATAQAAAAGWEFEVTMRIGTACRGYVVEVHDGKYRVILWLVNDTKMQSVALKDAATGKSVGCSLAGAEEFHTWKVTRRSDGQLALSGGGKELVSGISAGAAPGLRGGAPYIRVGGGAGIGGPQLNRLEVKQLSFKPTPSAAGASTVEPTTAAESAAKPTTEDTLIAAKYAALVAKLPADQQAWERVLQENLGGFYLPHHKRAKVAGQSTAWDFVQDDPKLPRVLLIGDSVSRGYTPAVRKALAGKANVHRAPANCGPTANGLKHIEAWLGDGKWDLIHFNFGIHDRATPIADYAQRLEQLIERMKKTGAKLIWASTTPIPDDPAKKQTAAAIVERNQVAAELIKKHGDAIDDLFAAITPHLAEMQTPNDVHFNTKGYDFLGETVAKAIEAQLPKR